MQPPTTTGKHPVIKAPLTWDNLLFMLVLLIELSLITFLIVDHRMPRGHDGFQYYSLQYYFLNNAATAGEIPQWMPFMTQGTVSNWWYAIQANLTQNFLLLIGTVFKGINFLPIFYLGIFFDELLLLVGTWLLTKRYFKSAFTRCFTATTVLGSCVWMDQPWMNFHFYYAIPLILHFLHVFLDTGRWRHCFLAGNLLALQTLGNMPYYIPVTSMVLFAYFAAYLIFGGIKNWRDHPALKRPLTGLACMALILISFISVYSILKIGTDQIASYNLGQNPDGTVPLVNFLTYANNMNPRMWMEIFLGVSPAIDYTLYFGLFSLPMMVLGLAYNRNKHSIAIWLVAILLIFLSLGGLVSFFCYSYWPMMKYYRHLSLVSPVAKLFLCFAAGFGFEAFVFSDAGRKRLFIALSAGLCGLSLGLFLISNDYAYTAKLIRSMVWPELISVRGQYDRLSMSMSLKISAVWALLAALALMVTALSGKKRSYLIYFILGIQTFDLFGYKYYLTLLKTFHVNESQYRVNVLQPMPYAERRKPDYRSSLRALPFRLDILADEFNATNWRYGVVNWTINSYLFHDELGNSSRVDHWLFPLDDFMRAYWKQPIRDAKIHPRGLYPAKKLDFPTNHVACLKFSGFSEDKIQVFSDALPLNSDAWIASQITSPDYKGDVLIISGSENSQDLRSSISNPTDQASLSLNRRLPAKYEALQFDANNLVVSVEMAGMQSNRPAWLFYSDVWHPFWKVTVNGEQKKLFKANLAYKSVQINPGKNIVRFSFGSKTMTFLFLVIGLNSLLWIVIVLWLIGLSTGLFNRLILLARSDLLQQGAVSS